VSPPLAYYAGETLFLNGAILREGYMVNPVITEVSQETQNFNHGCLSVPCPNRCAVTSPMTIRVTYLDPLDEMREHDVNYTGTDAVVLWHELTHIVSGKTYMDVTFEALPVNDLLQFYKLINNELRLRKTTAQKNIPELTVPPFHFSVRIDNGVPRLDSKVLEEIIPKISDETLMGLSNQAHCVLKSR
ncbi:peptide deformylase, partial [Legionella birminghamensis]